MISVKKLPKDAPDILTKKTREGFLETNRMIKRYLDAKKGKKVSKEDYAAYRDESVKQILEKIFQGKCAYCESAVSHNSFGDIEHFRPKKMVTTPNGNIPGYYWLGATWDNLLYSCELCNRKKKYSVSDKKKIAMGKQNQFPLEDEKFRCSSHTQRLKREEPYRLLLNPCIDNPAQHLEFDEKGFIHPKQKKGKLSRMGEETIKVVALQRRELVNRRRRRYLKEIKAVIFDLEDYYSEYKEAKSSGNLGRAKEKAAQVKRKIVQIKELLEPTEEYLAMTRQFLRPVLKNYKIKI